ncbi:tkl protein kinase [Plasmopara halstedii]|uniref:Tkl protein kinase n=1 Tax=Plasmopara halstedii TaxID=4781 RepID=A0A0P1ARS1_PLAHL|nr:tkl protein kinase [Plasmopara halstedii]CEG44066.1 tkl protein kinase [Plasmopara halstedii]|eukprot:XP_024580435.1 tkl protein kinase [Plasmopara halstedii]
MQYAEATRNIQITGFDDTNVQKGSLKSVTFDQNTFSTAKVLEQLILINLDLGSLPTGFLPSTISLLTMENCNLATLPSQLGNLANRNLVTLNLNKNTMTSITDSDSSVSEALQGLTTLNLTDNAIATFNVALPSVTSLDLSNNKLTEFPPVIFNMTNLNILNIAGNNIQSLTVTSTQHNFLRKLSAQSALSIKTSECSSGIATELLDSVICVSDDAFLSSESSSSSSSTLVIVVVVLAVILVFGVAGFFIYRHHMKSRGYRLSNTPDMVGVVSPPSLNDNPARNRAGSRGRAFSQQRRSSGPNILLAGLSDHGKKMSDAQPRRSSGQFTVPVRGCDRPVKSSIISANVVKIPSEELNHTRKIAKGAFGEVWLALHGKDLVAVKKLISVDGTSVQDFVSELNLLASLSHRCILSLIGACWDDELTDIQIVMEYMDSGDLLSVLRLNPSSILTWENGKASYCVQICEAVYYLHSLQPALIHRDIKSRNILVDSNKGAKLSDFGESRERTVARTMTAGVGTARWVAPEIILGEDYSELADIYSLGVLLTELDTHQIPYQTLGLEESMIVQQVAVGKLRPKVSDTCPEIIRRLTHECLQYDPSLRPSAARVLQTLVASPLVRRQSAVSVDNST